MTNKDWLKKVSEQIPKIMDIVKECQPDLQQTCFEILLKRAVYEGNTSTEGLNKRYASSESTQVCNTDNIRFTNFLEKYEITIDQISSLIDLESGHILTKKWSGVAENHRIIGCLLAVRNFACTGEFSFTKEEFKQICKDYGVQNINASRNLNNINKNYNVFQENSSGWKVYTRGEEDIANKIINLAS